VHYPLFHIPNPHIRSWLPATAKYMLRLGGEYSKLGHLVDVLDFHRLEPVIFFSRIGKPMNIFFHQDMSVLRDHSSDIRWRYLPRLYETMEKQLLPRLDSVFCVREEAAERYRRQYPRLGEWVHFTPTWFNDDLFYLETYSRVSGARRSLNDTTGWEATSCVFVFVGRLDTQKNPVLLLEAFRDVINDEPGSKLLIVGDGPLRGRLERYVEIHGLTSDVHFSGLMPPEKIAYLLTASDAFVLSSDYEGMPISLLEAMACGLPVIATRVGEIQRVVTDGETGLLVTKGDFHGLTNAMRKFARQHVRFDRAQCAEAVSNYAAHRVLDPIFANYRMLQQRYAWQQ